eukprot:198611-Rhodomonas_salina.2
MGGEEGGQEGRSVTTPPPNPAPTWGAQSTYAGTRLEARAQALRNLGTGANLPVGGEGALGDAEGAEPEVREVRDCLVDLRLDLHHRLSRQHPAAVLR